MNGIEPPSGCVTLVFTDIEDSSRMTAALGKTYVEQLLPPHNERIRGAVAAHRGFIVKTIGDSFMLAFQNARDALECAARIQEALAMDVLTAEDATGRSWQIRVRVGIHQSLEPLAPQPSPECAADYHGSDVNFAARVESLGCGGQIIVSDSAHAAAQLGEPEQWREWPNRRIKSFDLPQTVWEYLWDGQSRDEPGSRFLPDWFKGERNRYIPRPELEAKVLGYFGKLRSDGSVPRLVTLHAYGGSGKTRLAVACAIQMAGAFKDGVFFVPLDDKPPLAAAVAEAMGTELGMAPENAVPAQVLAALRDKNLLLLLDNYESVDCEEVQDFIIQILKSTRAVRMLVTGREAVKLADVEQEVCLDEGMTSEQAESLFLARARLKHPQAQQWEPDAKQRADVQRIIGLSNGIPLAVELAAAWISHSTLREIADGLEATPLGSTSKEPPRTARLDQAMRHRSLTRSLNYSFERLEPKAQEGLARLGLFAGSFTPESVKSATATPQASELLLRLQDASLVQRVEKDGRSRFTMLRPTRAYAEERFGQLPDASWLMQLFAQYFQSCAFRHKQTLLDNPDANARIAALDWFQEEWPNLLAASRYARKTQQNEHLYGIADGVFRFWQVRRQTPEVEQILHFALRASRESANPAQEATMLGYLGIVYEAQAHWAEAEQVFLKALALFRQTGGQSEMGGLLGGLGNACRAMGKRDQALDYYQQSLVLLRAAGSRSSEANTLNSLGALYTEMGRTSEALEVFEQNLAILRELKDEHKQAQTLNNLANVYRSQGHSAKAEQAYRECLAINRRFQDQHGEGFALANLGIFFANQLRLPEAQQVLEQSLKLLRGLPNRRDEAVVLSELGDVYGHLHRWAEAEQAHRQSLAVMRELNDRNGEGRILNNLGMLYKAQCRWEESEQAYQQYLALCRAMNDRIGESCCLNNLGVLYSAQCRWTDAEKAMQQCLKMHQALKDRYGEAVTLNNLVEIYFSLRKMADAENAGRQALAVYREVEDRYHEAMALHNLGIVYDGQRRWAEAEAAYQQSLTIRREIQDRHGESETLTCLGVLYREQLRWPEAESACQQCLAIKRELPEPRGLAAALINLADLYEAQCQMAKALPFAREAIEVLQDTPDQKLKQTAQATETRLVRWIQEEASARDDLERRQKPPSP